MGKGRKDGVNYQLSYGDTESICQSFYERGSRFGKSRSSLYTACNVCKLSKQVLIGPNESLFVFRNTALHTRQICAFRVYCALQSAGNPKALHNRAAAGSSRSTENVPAFWR